MVSVAFRRESDEEHKEPKFEVPIPPGPNLVTTKGLAAIEAMVAQLEGSDAATMDEETRSEHLRTLRYWRTRLATAQLAPPPPDDEVAFGSRVTFMLGGETRQIDIVGDDEAEPAEGRIAFSAPLARALIGGYADERIDFGGKTGAIKLVATETIPS